MGNNMTLCRKIKLYPVGDKEEVNRVYSFIRDGQYAQYQGLNLLMGQLTSSYYKYNRDIKNPNFKEEQKAILRGSNEILKDINFATGVDTKSAITQKVKQDFSIALKNGLAKGERTITNYKRTFPLITRGRDIKITHEYGSYNDLLDALHKTDLKLYVNWVNKIRFKIVFGNPKKSYALREEIKNIIEGVYKIQQSSILVDGKNIILNLSISIPKQELELDENTVVGVDLGIAIPAVCGLNNNDYSRKSIGSKDDFLRIRTQLQSQKRRLQKNLVSTKGGHGRGHKLKSLDKLSKRESNFVQTYNHFVSKQVVDFAISNKAKYINIEDLSSFSKKNGKEENDKHFILRNWSYYQLQQYIKYKAEKKGIEVRLINPYHTSQVCSKCGHWEEGQRDRQDHFKCKSCGYEDNADFNASKNIAKSIDFR